MAVMTPTFFADAQAFRAWLDQHAASATELLVGFHKVGSGQPCMTWSESVDEALCVGWIDGRRQRIDADSYAIRFTPRKASSIWSVVNIAKMDKLRAEGKMQPAGEAAFALRREAKSGIYAHERGDLPELPDAERERNHRCRGEDVAGRVVEARVEQHHRGEQRDDEELAQVARVPEPVGQAACRDRAGRGRGQHAEQS